MCGLVGIVGKIGYKEEKMFKNMLCLDTFRGPDSTGILSVDKDGDTKIFKDVGTPYELMFNKKWEDLFKGVHSLLLGHNRAATRGKVSKWNAHPYEFDKVIGAHNGTLNSTYALEGHGKFDVDSQVLLNHIEKKGIDDAIKKCNGPFALSYYDIVNHQINLIRNKDRPLYIASLNDGLTKVWASEQWIIQIAADYADVERPKDTVMCEVGKLYTIDVPKVLSIDIKALNVQERVLDLFTLPQHTAHGGSSNIFKPAQTTGTNIIPYKKKFGCQEGGGQHAESFIGKHLDVEVMGPKQSSAKQWFIEARPILYPLERVRIFQNFGSNMWNQLVGSRNYFRVKVRSHTTYDGGYLVADLRCIEEISEKEVKQYEFVGWNNRLLTMEQWLDKTAKGCCTCADCTDISEADEIIWMDEDNYMCSGCVEEITRACK